jgi:hypothetical protein
MGGSVETVEEFKLYNRAVLLNALPLNAIKYNEFTVKCVRAPLDAIKFIVKHSSSLENYIRHESTIRLLNNVLGLDLKPSSGLYEHRPLDMMIVVSLKRPIRGQEVEVKPEDLEYILCIVEV